TARSRHAGWRPSRLLPLAVCVGADLRQRSVAGARLLRPRGGVPLPHAACAPLLDAGALLPGACVLLRRDGALPLRGGAAQLPRVPCAPAPAAPVRHGGAPLPRGAAAGELLPAAAAHAAGPDAVLPVGAGVRLPGAGARPRSGAGVHARRLPAPAAPGRRV